jgi:hypothetical protein
MDHIERQNTNLTPSTGKLNYETNKSVSLDRWVRMWPTPTTSEAKSDTHNVQNRIDKDKQVMLCHAVRLYPTDPKTTGALNPQWVAWLMGYPTEYLNSVRWETASSRRSRKKSDKQ